MDGEQTELVKAYETFMKAKYPGKPVEAIRFEFFDPTDDQRDWNRGLLFVDANDDYLLKQPKDRKIGDIAKLVGVDTSGPGRLLGSVKNIGAAKIPPSAGWYADIGMCWMLIGETIPDASARFNRLAEQLG